MSIDYRFCTAAQVDSLCVIHYGATKYIPELVYPIKNSSINKPEGGLWTSPSNSSHSWKGWCDGEKFRDCILSNSFTLEFKPDTKILLIDNILDFENLPITRIGRAFTLRCIDFKSLSKKCDAIWLTENGETETRFPKGFISITQPLSLSLYGWDCESVFIINKKCCYQI